MRTSPITPSYRAGLDGWSPLTLHQRDLRGAESQRHALAAVAARSCESAASDLLREPRLTWLVRSLAAEVWDYLRWLGHDVGLLDARIRAIRPRVSAPGQAVPATCHPHVDLCAVYHVEAAAGSGDLRFLNSTRGTHVDYPAVGGRLTIFPASQRHEVLANRSSADCLSLWFEIEIGSAEEPNRYEEAMYYGALPHPVVPKTAMRKATLGVPGSASMSTSMSRLPATLDDLVASAQHVAGVPADAATWQLFQAGVAHTADVLDAAGFDASSATVAAPSIACRYHHEWSPFAVAPTDLQVYLRLDGGDSTCVVEYEDGEPLTALDRGLMVFVDGQRSHRVLGSGVLMRFGVGLGGAINEFGLGASRTAHRVRKTVWA